MRSELARMTALAAGGSLVVLIFAFCFLSAGHAPSMHGVRVGVVAPAPTQAALQQEINAHAPGAVTLVGYQSRPAALSGIDQRANYAALVVSPASSVLYVASAASGPVATALSAAFGQAFAQAHRPLTVTDIRPLPGGDSRGVSVLLTVIPLTIISVALAVAQFLVAPQLPAGRRMLMLVIYGLLAGVAAGVADPALTGALAGNWWAVAAPAAAIAIAVSLFTAGLMSLLGLPGAGVAALWVIIVGNACSGGATAPQMLPAFWRALSPLLPPGAGVTLLRNSVYFSAHAISGAVLVLAVYAVAGVAAIAAGPLIRTAAPVAARQPVPA